LQVKKKEGEVKEKEIPQVSQKVVQEMFRIQVEKMTLADSLYLAAALLPILFILPGIHRE
jgi:predicted nucleic acid-binding protein